jgi:hypothetical protein
MMHWMFTVLMAALILGGCSDGAGDSSDPGNNGTVNNGTANNGTANNGTANNGTAPARVLVADGLMGDLPMDNRVVDPEFTTFDFQSERLRYWYALRSRNGQSVGVPVYTWYTRRSPTRTNALRVEGGLDSDPTIYGFVKTGIAVHDASIWVGRDAGAQDVNAASVTVTILGFNPNSTDGRAAIDLERISDSRTEVGGRVWHRYVGNWRTFLAGWSYFQVQDAARENLFVAGPVVRDNDGSGSEKPASPPRGLTAREAADLGYLLGQQRARAGVQPAPLELPVLPR